MFADLSLGMPEAQAAYFNGYNGGVDQFGRVVTAPFGIDLAREVSIDIGLEPGNNDWINVSFLWTEGWDGGSDVQPPKPGETTAPQATLAIMIPIEVASPNPDGSVHHTVQEGQTMWNIAAAYQVDISSILSLNGMTDGSTIFPGQKLLIKPPITPSTTDTPEDLFTPTPTGTVEPSKTYTAQPATTLPPARQTPTPETILEVTLLSTSSNTRSSSDESGIDPVLTGIIGFGLTGAALFILGQWLTRKP
jgi:LysM repeat protein